MKSGLGCPYHDWEGPRPWGDAIQCPLDAEQPGQTSSGLEGVVERYKPGRMWATSAAGRVCLDRDGQDIPALPLSGLRQRPNCDQRAQQAVQGQVSRTSPSTLSRRRAPYEPDVRFYTEWDCLHDMVDPQSAINAIRRRSSRMAHADRRHQRQRIRTSRTTRTRYGMLYAISVRDCLAPATGSPEPPGWVPWLHGARGLGSGGQGGLLKPPAA